jgi:cytoskeletal protein RodZ
MKSIGQILQEARVTKKMEIVDIARITRIRPQFLMALEADDYSQLPSGTIARGFIKNYSQFLGLSENQILSVFRRDFIENPEGRILPRGIGSPISQTSLWTPKTTIIAIITTLLTLFATYIFYQYRTYTGTPPLNIERPTDQARTQEATIEIAGDTDPDAVLSVDGKTIALDKGGTFRFRIPLNLGENKVTIVAASKFGKTKSASLTIYHDQ